MHCVLASVCVYVGGWVWVHGRGRVLVSCMSRTGAILSASSLAPPYFSVLSHKRHDFWKRKLLNIKCVFWFSLQLLFETFLILWRIQRHIFIDVETSSCKVHVIFVGFWWKVNFLDRVSKKHQVSNLIKILPVGAELFHADGQSDGRTDGHHEANSRFSHFYECA